MAQKAGVPFAHASELKLFSLGQNRRVESWIAHNWERAGMTGPIDKSYVSKALSSLPVLEPVVNALGILFDEITSDPWEWCKPPEQVEDLADYAPLSWWYVVLDPPVAWTAFASMSSRPLKAAYREVTQTRLSEWRSRLRAACDQYKADHALVRALRADEAPEYCQDDDGQRHRVGNPGLHGRTPDEIGLAYALSRMTLPLPLIKEARLAYDRPNASPVHDHVSEPVEPWNGLEFEGVERADWESLETRDGRPVYRQVENHVRYYWDGQRYQIEDIYEGQFARVRDADSGQWRDTTAEERDHMITRMERKHETVDELLARRDQWIADKWASAQEDNAAPLSFSEIKMGTKSRIPTTFEDVVAAFEREVESLRTSHVARNEQVDLARARMKFRHGLRPRR